MIDALPPWLRGIVLVLVCVGMIALWTMTLTGLWTQEQERKRASAPPVPRTPTSRPVRGPHDLRNVVLMVVGAVALLVGAAYIVLEYDISGAAGYHVTRAALFLAIVAVAGQRWQARRKAKRAEAERQYPTYRPYQGQ